MRQDNCFEAQNGHNKSDELWVEPRLQYKSALVARTAEDRTMVSVAGNDTLRHSQRMLFAVRTVVLRNCPGRTTAENHHETSAYLGRVGKCKLKMYPNWFDVFH